MSQVIHFDDVMQAEAEAEARGYDVDENVEPENPKLEADADPDLGRAEDDRHGVEPEAER